jgi:hypothetical protein
MSDQQYIQLKIKKNIHLNESYRTSSLHQKATRISKRLEKIRKGV